MRARRAGLVAVLACGVLALAVTLAQCHVGDLRERSDDDAYWMRVALAQIGPPRSGEGLPIGAVIVERGRLLAVGHNRIHATHDPLEHAEVMALRAAVDRQRRVAGLDRQDYFGAATLYTTLEPCPMCAGTMTMLRVRRVVYCEDDHDWGALGTVARLDGALPWSVRVEVSDLPECRALRSARTIDRPLARRYGAEHYERMYPTLARYLLRRIGLAARAE